MLPAYILLGQVYTEKFDFENMQKAFSDAENQQLHCGSLFFEWGKCLEKFNKLDDAKSKFEKALEQDNENPDILIYLALCCAEHNEIEEAKSILKKIQENTSNSKIFKQISAIIAYSEDDLQYNDTKVKDCYETAIRLNPHYIRAFEDFSKYLIEQNEYAEAQRKLRKALKVAPKSILLLNLMFYVSYILVKDKVCEYNIKETISIANTIESIAPELFEYPEQKQELKMLLDTFSERE